jgi:hypothetical protein
VTSKYEKKSFNLIGFDWDGLVTDTSYKWQTTTFRDAFPLLESEVLAIEVPSYVDDNAYTIQYVLQDDTDVELVPNLDIVKVVADANQGGVVGDRYLYVGAPAELVLSEQNYADTQLWSDVTGTTSDADVDYLSSFKNFTFDRRTWVTGGGWLTQKTYHTLIIQTFGQKDYYTHTLKADYPIAISYLQAPGSPSIRIAAAGNVYLQETITAPRQGTVSLTSLQGDIIFGETAAVLGASPTIQAGGSVRVNVEGGAVASGVARAASLGFQAEPSVLSITSAGDLELHAVRDPDGNGSDTMIVGQIVSTGGQVILVAPGGIQAYDDQSLIRGNRIELVAVNGGIGSAALPLAIDSDLLDSGGVAARALGDIHIREVQGDLKLAAPQDEQNSAASVQSGEGNVTLQVAAGSILDAVQEDLETRTQEEIEAYAQQMQLTGDDARQAVATALRSEEGLQTERYHDYWREYRKAKPSTVVRASAIQRLDADNDVISFSQPHGLQSGDEVFVGSADAANPGFAYYAVVTSATSLQLATTRYDAVLRDVPVVMDITPPWIELHEEQSLLVYNYSVLALSDPSLGEVPEIFRQIHDTYGADEYDPNFVFQFTPDQCQERIDARTFSAEALRSPVAASLFGLLYPAAGSAGGSAGGEERSNIVGQRITLIVGAGTVGRAGTPLDISLSNGFESLSEEERQTLAMSTTDDVLAVDYAVYQYQGDAGDVDLLKADFNDSVSWEKLLPDYVVTGATQWEWLEIGDTVQVRVPLGAGGEPQFGVYRYQGGAAAWLDLSRQDYTGSGDWDSVAQFDAIEGTRALSPGDCVGRIEGLTVETTNDIDLQAQAGLAIEASNAVWVSSAGEMRIESIAASGAVRLQAGGSIINLGAGPLAMPELTARAGQDIHLLGITGPVVVSTATALGDIEFSVADFATPNDDLVLADGAIIRAAGGSVALDAGDSLVVPATGRIAAADGVSLGVDSGDADPGQGGTLQILGSIDAVTTAISGGSDGDAITLTGVAAGNVTTIQAGGGDDEIRVGDELGQVLGQLSLDAGSGSDRLILRDEGNGAAAPEQAGRIETAQVRGFGMPADGWIEHEGLEFLTITTGPAADAIDIDSAASLLLTVETGDGADSIEVYRTGSGLGTEIHGGSGDDTVRIRGADALGAVNFAGGGHGSQGDRLLFGPQGYATDPAAIPDPVPADVTTIRLRDGAGNPVGPVHTFSTVEHVIILPPPAEIALMPWGLPENTDTGDEDVEVGQFEAFSQIAGAGCTFSLVAGSGDDDNSRFVILGDRLFLKQGTLLDYESQALYAVRVRVSNGFNHVDRQLGVAVTDVNEAPELMQPIPNQSATENVPFLFQLAADAFRDPDAGDVLSYSAALGDGSPLPSWLSFDAPTRTFSGRPGFTDEGPLMIVVRAADTGTPPLARATTFELLVMPNAVPWQNPTNRWDVDASGSPSDPFPGDVLAVINFINGRGILQLPAPPSSLGPPPYLDVTGDGWVTPADVLDIINVINGRVVSSGESEPTCAAVPPIGTSTAAVRTVDFASFVYDQSRRVESGLRQDREEAVSAIMGKWTPADEYLDCILAPSDTARPFCLRSADAARNDGQADNGTGNAEEDWLLFALDQGPAAELLDQLVDPWQLSWHQTGMGRSGVGPCRAATAEPLRVESRHFPVDSRPSAVPLPAMTGVAGR